MKGAFLASLTAVFIAGCGYFESVVSPVEPTPATLNGKVVDSVAGMGLSGATVLLRGIRDTVTFTDGDGFFSFSVTTTGEKTVTVTLNGYLPWTGKYDLEKAGNDLGVLRLVRENSAPGILKILYPPQNGVEMPLTLSFRWMAGDADYDFPTSTERLDYCFYFGRTNPPPLLENCALALNALAPDTTVSAVSYHLLEMPDSVFSLDSNATYFWRVVVRDALGDSAVHAVDSFRTRGAFDTVCPAEMALVEMESLSFCMDRTEFTNDAYMNYDSTVTIDDLPDYSIAPDMPVVNVYYDSAKNACAAQGKRLCHILEWQAASGGTRHTTYPYGDYYDSLKCQTNIDVNQSFAGVVKPVGTMDSCLSPYGIYDLSGNAAEWVERLNGMSFVDKFDEDGAVLNYYAGGFWSSAEKSGTYELNATSKKNRLNIGFRCCKSIR